jgi:uncharacterized protein
MTRAVLPGYEVRVAPVPAEPTPLRTDVAGFAGRAVRGRAGASVLVRDFAEFTRVFGPPTGGSGYLAEAVRGYFSNGGRLAYVVRILGSGASAATGVMSIEGRPPIHVSASSPGAAANDMTVTVARRTARGGRPVWTVSAQPLRAEAETAQAVGPAGLADAAGQLELVRLDLPEPSGPEVAWPDAVPEPARLSGGSDGRPPGEREYQDAARLLVDQPEVALLGLPDLWGDLGAAAHGFVTFLAERVHGTLDRMLVLDLPPDANDSTAAALAALDDLDEAVRTPQARAIAVYHPWIKVRDWADRPDALPAEVPPSGYVMGLISRLDRERGPSRTPANAPLVDVVDLVGGRVPVSQAALTERRVNPIRSVPGRGLQVWGGRTFDRAPDARFIAHRRLAQRLIRAARRAAEPLVFEPNGPELRLTLTRAITTVLLSAYRSGALLGRSPAEAFSVETTSESEDRVVCEIQFAPADPMEYIRVRLILGPEGRLEVIER